MNLTQLASMFIGSPVTSDDDLRKLEGVTSTTGNIIHITHGKSDEILDIITAKNIKDNVHFKSLKTGEETFDAELIGEQNYDEHLVKGNRIIIPSEYEGEYVEFVIDRVIDSRNNSKDLEVYSYASFVEIAKAKVIDPFTFLGTAEQHLGRALSGTEHEVGVVESAREITISFNNHTEPYEYIKRIANEFDLEPNFRVLHNGLLVTNRPVDLIDKIGSFRGREFTFGKDLEEIKRTESGDIYTALIGLGPEDDDGNRNEVFVDDLDALNIWGRPDHNGDLQHLIGVYEPQSDDDNMSVTQLRKYTQTELNKRKSAITDYEMMALDLEHVKGHSEKITRFGDVIRGKDTTFTPNLYVEARIFEMKRNVVTPMQKEYKFGDFVEFDEVDVHVLFNRMKKLIDKKAGIDLLREYAEPKRIESSTAPTGQNEHVIWIDTSKKPYVSKVYNSGAWENLSPTTAAEIDAYNKSQVDSKNSSTLSEAKTHADNAAQAAESAANGVAVAEIGLAEARASADASGKVSAEEQRAIQDAEDKLAEAKADANTKANAAESAAKSYADAQDVILKGQAAADATNKSDAARDAAIAKAEQEAAQALADAKAYSKNASNIESGVVDVGQVPLRSSITGARLEWDGINGFVQYDSSGTPVAWIDLEGKSHFSHAFISGRIEALEGYFGDNIRLVDGKLEIVRPDGAVSVSSGLLQNSYSVSQDDPYYMTSTSHTDSDVPVDLIFVPGGHYGSIYKSNTWYVGMKYMADGRGGAGYRDRRDDLNAVAFQKYEFMHSSRYLVFHYWVHGNSGKHSLHIVNGTSQDVADRIYFQLIEAGTTGVQKCVIDLGKPLFNKREVTFKIGWTHGWGPWDDEVIFRMKSVIQTDVL